MASINEQTAPRMAPDAVSSLSSAAKTKESVMPTKSLRQEHDRQDKVIADLSEADYSSPLFNSKFAIQSARKTAYHDTAAASAEIVDNAIEAGANRIHVIFDRGETKGGKKRKSVSQVAFIDDGAGMSPEMIRFALSWGGGIHHDEPEFIGKFGFGLPNASVNQTELTQVYSRRNADEPWMRGELDVNAAASANGNATIPAPMEAPDGPPEFVRQYLERNKLSLETGTVVVWVDPDNLYRARPEPLASHLVSRFGQVYRYLLEDFELKVEGKDVQPIDPLFVTPGALHYVPEESGGARVTMERHYAVKHYVAEGEPILEAVDKEKDLPKQGDMRTTIGTISVRSVVFPIGFAFGGSRGKVKIEPLDEFAPQRMRIRQATPRGVSFIRAAREIEVGDKFPRSTRAAADGLGDWPALQSYAYHYGLEVRFTPELDDVFCVTNDKQGVRPIEGFWKLLASDGEEWDKHLHYLDGLQRDWRKDREEEEKKQSVEGPSEEPSAAETAAAAADRYKGDQPTIPDNRLVEAEEQLEEEARELVEQETPDVGGEDKASDGVTKEAIERAKEAIRDEAKRRRYMIDYFEESNGPFYRPEWRRGGQVVVLINKLHPFFRVLYLSVLTEGGNKGKQGIDTLLLALARSELVASDPDLQQFYEVQREEVWSPLLARMMKALDSQFADGDEQEPDDLTEAAG